MEVDLTDRPVYKFGNGEVKRVLCRVKFKLQVKGVYVSFLVHAVDAPGIPILVSIETLRQLGAVIDFEAGIGVFKSIDPHRMISFQRSRTGHLLIDLACDLLGDVGVTDRPGDCILSRGVASLSSQAPLPALGDTVEEAPEFAPCIPPPPPPSAHHVVATDSDGTAETVLMATASLNSRPGEAQAPKWAPSGTSRSSAGTRSTTSCSRRATLGTSRVGS
eukprot:3987150-Pyramimonas_sp.AAC.1